MTQDIIAAHGHLFLGSRLKRLAERLQTDAARVFRNAGIETQPAQMALLATLDRNGPLTVGEVVGALGVAQPGVTRTAATLVESGLVAGTRTDRDQRQRTLALTDAGAALLARARTDVWPRIDQAAAALCAGLSGPLLDQLATIEAALDQRSFEQRADTIAPGLTIREYADDLADAFRAINTEWIERMFTLEPNDIDILNHPRARIVDRGGVILFVEAPGIGVVGTAALIRIDEGCFELTKMGVLESTRGRKAGEFLLRHILARAEAMRLDTLYLLTNSKCQAAIHLYEKVGFEHDAGIMERFGRRYARCDVAMAYPGLRPTG